MSSEGVYVVCLQCPNGATLCVFFSPKGKINNKKFLLTRVLFHHIVGVSTDFNSFMFMLVSLLQYQWGGREKKRHISGYKSDGMEVKMTKSKIPHKLPKL